MATNTISERVARIGVACSDVNFAMRAFSDYCERKQENLNELLNLMQESISLVPDDGDNVEEISTKVLADLSASHPGYNWDQTILLDGGYTTIKSCIDLTVKSVLDADKAGESPKMALRNTTGGIIESITYSDFAQDLQAQLHSLCGLVACNRAQLYESFSDKLQAFNDTMNSTFANAYGDISSSLGYYKAILAQNLSPVAYLQNIATSMDLDHLADDSTDIVPAVTDIAQYTGASPAGPLNFQSFTDAASTVVNTGLKVVKGIFNAVKGVVSPIVKKAVGTVKETLVDPYDLYVVNEDDAVASVTQLCYYGSKQLPATLWGAYGLDDQHYNYIKQYYLSHNKWFKLGLVGGELLFRVKSIDESKTLDMEYRYRPKTVSSEFISTVKRIFGSSTIITDDILAKLTSLTSSADFYLNVDAAEDDVYAGFYRGALFDKVTLKYAGELSRSGTGVLPSQAWDRAWTPDKLSTANATNKDFVNITSGLIETPGSEYIIANYAVLGTEASSDKLISIESIAYDAICCLSNNLIAEFDSPTDFPFFPYRYDKEDFSSGKFAIKTDSENFNAFNTFMTSAIIVTVGVLTAAALGCVAKRLMNKVRQKALEKKSVLDQKMWNGEKLSAKEAKQYRRASKKVDCSSQLTSSLQTNSQSSSVNAIDSSSSSLSGIQSLKTSIVG